MATFTSFKFDTTITAAQMNENFQAVAGGNWLPLGGAQLEPTGSMYDIGAQGKKWKNVYCNDLHVLGNDSSNCWNVIASVTLSSTALSIDFSGLHEFSNIIVEFSFIIEKSFLTIYGSLNGNTTGAICGSIAISAKTVSTSPSQNSFIAGEAYGQTSSTQCSGRLHIRCKPDETKFIISNYLKNPYGLTSGACCVVFTTVNILDTISSIQLSACAPGESIGSLCAGTTIKLLGAN